MRHLKAGKKLNRSASHRVALMRNLVTALLRNERIQTTDAKAKELRGWADRLITLGKEGSLHARRQASSVILDRAVVRKLFETIAPRFQGRSGGYTRAVKIGWRRGDHAPVSVIELIDGPGEAESSSPRRRRRSVSRAARKAEDKGAPVPA
ncbi:MAG: 50S ribosomal protein L17 [Candidatus Binatia bacterium]